MMNRYLNFMSLKESQMFHYLIVGHKRNKLFLKVKEYNGNFNIKTQIRHPVKNFKQ